jgi:hypothetical protein
MGGYGDDLEGNLGALFKPNRSDWEKFKTTMDLAVGLGQLAPGVGVAIRAVAFGRAWFLDGKKADRVTPVLLGLYERIAKLEADAKDYIRKDEAQIILEETLARIADQPDEPRREEMQRVLFRILEKPRDLAENKLFVRLADELSSPALKLLSATHAKVESGVRMATKHALAQYAGILDDDAAFWLKFLISQGLIDEEQLGRTQYGTYDKLLTPLGRIFEEYRRK